jgi:hypothetical protein
MAKKKKQSAKSVAHKYGFRSGLEESVAKQLDQNEVEYDYESKASIVKFIEPAKNRTYLPDFKLPNGIIVETKGRFLLADRKKHELIKQQHPELDIRFVFTNSRTKITKKSKTTYGEWCDKIGIPYADKLIPQQWIEESPKSCKSE